jgi:hypothetical protein
MSDQVANLPALDDAELHREWTWRAHPARERPGAATLGGLAVVLLSGAAALFFGHSAFALPAALFLLLSLNRFFFPSRFRIDSSGIHGDYPIGRKSFTWKDVRRVAEDDRGLWLSSRARPSRLDAYQGMHVLFGAQRAEVSTRIRQFLESEETCSIA